MTIKSYPMSPITFYHYKNVLNMTTTTELGIPTLTITELVRVFNMEDDDNNKRVLDDPDPSWSPEQVLNHYTMQYPILGTATILRNGIIDGMEAFEFASTIGTKS
jgi:PRTRC genetic system protein C